MDEQKKTSGSLALNSTPQVITIPPSDPVRVRKLRVAAYARVSSSSEDQLNSFAAQNAHYWEPSGETAVLCGTFPPCGHIVKRVPRHSCAADKPFTHSESTLANTDIIYDFSHSGNSINSLFSAIRQTGFGKISPSRIFII